MKNRRFHGLTNAELVENLFRAKENKADKKAMSDTIAKVFALCETASMVFYFTDSSSTKILYDKEVNAMMITTYVNKEEDDDE